MRSLLHRLRRATHTLRHPGCTPDCCSVHAERMALDAYGRMAQRRAELLGRSEGGTGSGTPSPRAGASLRPAGLLSSPSAPARPVT